MLRGKRSVSTCRTTAVLSCSPVWLTRSYLDTRGNWSASVNDYLTLPEVIHVAELTLGSEVHVYDHGLLESALARPQTSTFGSEACAVTTASEPVR
jgi:hypothetical protein